MFDRAIVKNSSTGKWSVFSECVDVLTADDHSQVLSVLESVERRARNEQLEAVGYVAYEASHAFDPKFPRRDIEIPLVCFALFATETVVDSLAGLYAPCDASPDDWSLVESRDAFEDKVVRIRQMIGAGEVYQINLTSRMRQLASVSLSDFARWAQDMPHAVFLGGSDLTICSASPELFFERDKGHVWSKPMKGTVGRRSDAMADEANAHWLQHSRKNRAENVMITDMVRNDLARLSSGGKVSVDDLFDVERYPSVWQMTSTVKCEVDASVADIFTALFPAASITGAPKHAAVEVIHHLEQHPREIYTGAVGRISPSGFASFNVAIRTAWSSRITGDSRFGSGCGIVWDSNPREEFEELQTKARILKQADPNFHLFETMRVEAGVISRRARHLFRLENSARYWAFDYDAQKAVGYLEDLLANIDKTEVYRLRLQLNRDGSFSHGMTPHLMTSHLMTSRKDESIDKSRIRLALVQSAVESDDPYLAHKTSQRVAYERAIAEVPEGFAPVMFNTGGHVTESAIANIVYELDGQLFTPPLSDGLLPGVLRDELLDEGTIVERCLPISDLGRVREFWLINSLRGWRRASLCNTSESEDK